MLDVTAGIVNIVTAFAVHADHQLAAGADGAAGHPGAALRRRLVQQKIIVEFRKVRKINSKITGAYNENITGVRVVKALGREEENLREFGELTGEMYRGRLPRGLAVGAVPAGRAGDQRGGDRRHRLLRRLAGGDRRADHRRHPGVHLLRHVHDVADPGPGARLCRDAALDRLGRAHLLADGRGAGRGRSGRRDRSRLDPRRHRIRPRRFRLRRRQTGAERFLPEGEAGRD